MPKGIHEVVLELPIDRIWNFVSLMDNWAPLVPGYISHEIINESESTWKFKGDLGFVKKKVKLKVDITGWEEPNKVTFNLTGRKVNFAGNGYFEAEEIEENKYTKVTGCLDITAAGPMASMVNAALKSFVPETARELTTAVANEIMKIEQIKP